MDDVREEGARLRKPQRAGAEGRDEARCKLVVAISGSPSSASRTSSLADHALAKLVSADISVENIRLTTLNPEALLRGKYDDSGLRMFTAKVSAAHGIIVATPIFKAAYSGLMKAALDVLPQFAMAGKVVLPVGTGGSAAHALALDYALRPVLQSMGARHVVQSCLVCESEMIGGENAFALSPAADAMLAAALANFRHSLSALDEVKTLGHPRPHQA